MKFITIAHYQVHTTLMTLKFKGPIRDNISLKCTFPQSHSDRHLTVTPSVSTHPPSI